MIYFGKNDSVLNTEWQNIEFKNFDSNSHFHLRETPEYVRNVSDSSLVINIQNKYTIQQKLIKLLSHDTVFNYSDGIYQIQNLFPSIKHAYSQLKTDFYRENCTINNHNVRSYETFIHYIEYSISDFMTRKTIISSCTQAIMSIPLLAINQYFDLEQYVLGEVDSEVDDKAMYIDVEINENEWGVYIQKPLRIFDTYGTLYCVLLDLNIDKDGMVVSIRPFL